MFVIRLVEVVVVGWLAKRQIVVSSCFFVFNLLYVMY